MPQEAEWPHLALEFPAQEDVFRRRQIIGQCQVLIDRLDAQPPGFAGAMDMGAIAREMQGAGRWLVNAGHDLDQRGFARAIIPHKPHDLAGLDGKADVGQGADGPEFLGHALEFQKCQHVLPLLAGP